jgi:hypothetical protein
VPGSRAEYISRIPLCLREKHHHLFRTELETFKIYFLSQNINFATKLRYKIKEQDLYVLMWLDTRKKYYNSPAKYGKGDSTEIL